jgi:3-oxoadipate enol-lactonase
VAFLERPDGCRIYFEVHGEPARPALILLEGMGGDISGWRRNIPTLSRELQVIAFDFRGNGRSDEPAGACTMDTFVADTVGLLDHLRIERAHVYGQSFGGMVAQLIGLDRPERVRTLILAATTPGGEHAIYHQPKVPMAEPWRGLYSPGFAQAHPERVAEDLNAGGSLPKHPMGRRRQWEAMQTFDAYERLGKIRAPTLVIHGTDDRMVDPQNARVLASRIPGAELVWVEGAGHVYHSEQPVKTDREILGFIRSHGDA